MFTWYTKVVSSCMGNNELAIGNMGRRLNVSLYAIQSVSKVAL